MTASDVNHMFGGSGMMRLVHIMSKFRSVIIELSQDHI